MNFTDPSLLFLLWAVVPVAGLLAFGIRTRKKLLARFADPVLHPVLLPGVSMTISWIKGGVILAAFVMAVISLAGPQAGFRWEETREKGVDIMIALDCSQSMLAQDIKPTRLEQAKREIIDLTRMMHSDRAGLVAFSGLAVLQCPLTLDYEAFQIFLRVLEPAYLPLGGTNVAAALETCYNGFEKGSDTDKAILLITDGENTAGDVDEIVKKIAAEGIKIFCIGVGDPTGAPIPDPGGGFKKDASGTIILSRVDEAGLEKIAAATQGRYVRSVAGTMDLDEIYTKEILNTMEQKTLTQGKKKVWEQRFQWFLLPAVLLLILELFLPIKGWSLKKQKKKNGSVTLGILLLFLVLFPRPATAQLFSSPVKEGIKAYEAQAFDQAKTHFIDAQLKNPDNPKLYYNIGAAAYMEKAYDQAEKNFAQAALSQDPVLNHQARYNLANTRYRLGKFDEAIEAYESILADFPDDTQTKENLEFVKQKQKEQQEQQKEREEKESTEKSDSKQDPDQNQEQNPDKKSDKNQENQAQQNQESSQNLSSPGQEDADKNSAPETRDTATPDPAAKDSVPGETAEPDSKNGSSEAAESGQGSKEGAQASALLENRLNRLEDKPGMGMIPVIQDPGTGKDW